MKRLYVFSAICCSLAACGKPANVDPKAPAEQPAVINMPSAVQLADPMKAIETPKPSIIPDDPAQRRLAVSTLYAQATAMMVFKDVHMLSQVYGPKATLTLPDSTVRGAALVANALVSFARTRSLADFARTSQGMRVVNDSTLADSGTYVMTLKRTPNDSVLEHGRYAATIGFRLKGGAWGILTDRITPAPAKGKKK